MWLNCVDQDDKSLIDLLWCAVYRHFEDFMQIVCLA